MRRDNYKNHFYTGQKISKKIIDAIEQGISGEEQEDIKSYFSSNEYSQRLISEITSPDKMRTIYDKINSRDKHSDINRLIQSIEHKKVLRQRNRLVLTTVTVAVAIIFLSMLIWRDKTNQSNEFIISGVVNEQYRQPTLILENGATISTVELNDKIANNNYSIERTKDNKLEYKAENGDKDSVRYNKLIVPAKYIYTVVLSDGTEVTLNAGSTLEYPANFGDNPRKVTFAGEAYFKVAKSEKPFIIGLDDNEIKVYGTEFNVNKNSSGHIKVVLIEGSMGFKAKEKQEVVLKPSQMITFDNSTKNITLETVNTENFTGWLDNMFFFKDRSIYDILNDIALWYGVKININKNILRNNYTFVLERNTPIEKLMEYIADLTKLTIIKEGKEEYTVE